MKIFVSWSGERSQALALALRDWLPLVLHYVEPWLSTSDIKSGDRWGSEIAKELQASNFGIICVTKDNLEAPWLLFEAGALAKSMEDGRVIPLRLDVEVSDISGPLTQFQSEKADEDGINRLVTSLNKAAAAAVPEDRLAKLFEMSWPKLSETLEAIPASGSSPKRPRPQAEILEELVSGIRTVEMRVRDLSEDDFGPRRRIRRRLHPEMMMDFAHRFSERGDDPVQILMAASMVREDFPWVYELALDAYRAIQAGDSIKAKKTYSRFRDAIKQLSRGPFLEFSGPDSKMNHMMLMDMLHLLPPEPTMMISHDRPQRRRVRAQPPKGDEN